jgi:hypothetical protein
MMEIVWADHARNEEELHRTKEGRNIPTYSKIEGRLAGLVTSCVGTAFWNMLLQET